ncbi:MAG: PEP-CTERM sorting domain-containing protein [Cyanobacteria bacterium P01_H01_bin.15]
MDGSCALIGSPRYDDNGSDSGSAYLFSIPPAETTPEPISLLGLLGVVAVAASRRRSR